MLGLEICGVTHQEKWKNDDDYFDDDKNYDDDDGIKGKHFLSYRERRKLHKGKPLWNA